MLSSCRRHGNFFISSELEETINNLKPLTCVCTCKRCLKSGFRLVVAVFWVAGVFVQITPAKRISTTRLGKRFAFRYPVSELLDYKNSKNNRENNSLLFLKTIACCS